MHSSAPIPRRRLSASLCAARKGTLTYGTLIMHVDAFASDLARKGVSVGQRVAVWLPSRAETVIALLACSRNGYVCSPSLHRDHTVGDAVNLLKRMRATAVVAEEAYGADATKNDLFAQLSEVGDIAARLSTQEKCRGPRDRHCYGTAS